MENYFKKLSAINVKGMAEKKGNFNYLSWANAWSLIKEAYPDAQRKVYESEQTELPYFTDGKTASVKVGIMVNGIEHIDYLPVMDYRNKSILLDSVTSFDVNKAIQRSTTKALALHGLGLYIYAGEDLPEGYEPPAPVKPKLDTQRLNGALESIKNGNYTYDKLIDTFTLTPAQVKKAEKFVEDLAKEIEDKKELARELDKVEKEY